MNVLQWPQGSGPDPTEDDMSPRSGEFPWCEACQTPLFDRTRFAAFWEEKGRRVSFCRDCLGEIFFDILPMVTGPTSDTPSGRGSPVEEPDPWQENAIRLLEDAGG